MNDLSSLVSLFTSQATQPAASMPWQQTLLEQVDPQKARRQNIAAALQKASAALATTPGNFLTGLASAASTGAGAYHEGRLASDQRRVQAMQAIDQANREQQNATLSRLRDAIGVQSGYENTQYGRERDRVTDNQWQQSFNADQQYRTDQLAASKRGRSIMDDVTERRAAAESMGLTPQDPAYEAYVLTGKMPREDQAPLTATDKKAILESDDAVLANQTAIDALKSVIQPDESGRTLNDVAGSGMTADMQSWAARNDPTGLLNDETGAATTNLKNIVLGQALGSLKATFGAAPTEGERKILIELQASVDKTPAERKAIIDRAIKLAERRMVFNQQRAQGLRGGDYYKPQEVRQPEPTPQQGQGAPQPLTRGDIRNGYKFRGGNPNDRNSWEPETPATPIPLTPGAEGKTSLETPADALQQARDAIAQGADPQVVRQRLMQAGIDPAGL